MKPPATIKHTVLVAGALSSVLFNAPRSFADDQETTLFIDSVSGDCAEDIPLAALPLPVDSTQRGTSTMPSPAPLGSHPRGAHLKPVLNSAPKHLWLETPPLPSLRLKHDRLKATHTRRCSILWRLKLGPQQRVARLTTSLDGLAYTLSDRGTLRVTLAHGIENLPKKRQTEFLTQAAGRDPDGLLRADSFRSETFFQDLPAELKACGAEIPLETSVFITLAQPTRDFSGITSLRPERLSSCGPQDPNTGVNAPSPERLSRNKAHLCLGQVEIVACEGEEP